MNLFLFPQITSHWWGFTLFSNPTHPILSYVYIFLLFKLLLKFFSFCPNNDSDPIINENKSSKSIQVKKNQREGKKNWHEEVSLSSCMLLMWKNDLITPKNLEEPNNKVPRENKEEEEAEVKERESSLEILIEKAMVMVSLLLFSLHWSSSSNDRIAPTLYNAWATKHVKCTPHQLALAFF